MEARCPHRAKRQMRGGGTAPPSGENAHAFRPRGFCSLAQLLRRQSQTMRSR